MAEGSTARSGRPGRAARLTKLSAGTMFFQSSEGDFTGQEATVLKVHDWGLTFGRPISANNVITVP